VDCTESPDEEHVPIVGKLLDGCAEHGVEIVGEDDIIFEDKHRLAHLDALLPA